MPDAIITSTASTFGTISGTFAADQSTISGTILGPVAGSLSGSVGVPGPAGVGVPAGGLEGQIIVKASETDYDTVWVDNSAETLTATVRNETGATLTKGTVVYINGAAGNKATVTKASASTESGSSKTFAILKDDILNNQNGTAVTVGLLKGVDTSAFSPGANLWLSTTAGQITQTMPTSPNHAVFLGNAVRIHANQGEIEVRIQNGLELGELHDVLIHDVANGQVLKYDSAQGLWVNGTDVGGVAWGGITGTLSDQTDLQTALDGKYSTSNPAGYITSSALTGYATESFVTSQGYITSAALSPYLLSSTAASTYQTIAGMSSYLTTSAAASTYYPLTNPSGYITSSALAGYATESWVTAGFYPLSSNPAGYLTSASLSGYATESWVTGQLGSYLTTSAAASTYAALAGATFTGVVGFNGASGNVAAKSTGYFKAYTSGLESTDFSLQYDTGFQVVVGGTAVARLGASGILAPSSGITFSDASVQTTAFTGFSGYATESWVTAGFYPLTGNPSGFITSAALSGYAPLASPSLTGNVTITTNSSSPALFITQTGTGNILTLHDQASDTTFVAIDQNGKVGTIASTTANAGFNVPHGTAPTSPVNGDIWTTTGGIFWRQNGTTQQAADLGSTQTISGAKTFSASSLTFGSSTSAGTINVATGAIASGIKTVNIGSAGTSGSTTNINIGTTSGGTCTTTVNALLLTRASATTGSGLRIPHGTAPTTPTNGDVWTDTAGFYARINGATVTLTPPTAATVAEAKAGTDTAKFISANVLQKVVNSPSYYKFPRGLLTGSTSGTGASVASGALITNIIGTTTGAGWAQYKYYGISGIDIVNATGWRVGGQSIDFSKKFRLTGSTNMLGALPTNTIVRVMFGKNANDGGGDPTQRCIGWRYNQATGFIEIIAHNGTTLSTLTTASNPAASSWFEWELYNDGAGNVQMFVNDTSIGTVTGGPVSPDFGSAPTYVEEVQCTATPSAQPQVRFRNGGLFLQP